VRHFSVTLRNSGASRNLLLNVSIMDVSNIYPRGIQLRKRRRVSSVVLIRLGWLAVAKTSWQSLKIDANSLHMLAFKFLVFVDVI